MKTTLAHTKENSAIVKALKQIHETEWVGSLVFENIETCLVSINFDTTNSGLYDPIAIRLKGLVGIFMINQNGSIKYDSRVIKISDNSYRVEHLSNDGFDRFYSLCSKFIEEAE